MKKLLISLAVIIALLGVAGGLMYLFGATPISIRIDTQEPEPAVTSSVETPNPVHEPEPIPTPTPVPTPTPTPEPSPSPEITEPSTKENEEKKEEAKKESGDDKVQTDEVKDPGYNGWQTIPANQLPQPDGADVYQYNGSTVVVPTYGQSQKEEYFLGIKPDEPVAYVPGYNTTDTGTVTASVSDLSRQIFELTNKERTSRGLSELTYAYDLQSAADTRAKEASVKFSHTRPDGTSCHDIVTKDYYVTGENLIMADKPIASAENLVAEWMNSEGHRYNILLPEFKELAVGVCEKDGVVYAAQIFCG